jgi:hypothetical protein
MVDPPFTSRVNNIRIHQFLLQIQAAPEIIRVPALTVQRGEILFPFYTRRQILFKKYFRAKPSDFNSDII